MYRRFGSATLLQFAFPGESNPNFPWEKSERNTVVRNVFFSSIVKSAHVIANVKTIKTLVLFSRTDEAAGDCEGGPEKGTFRRKERSIQTSVFYLCVHQQYFIISCAEAVS